MSGVFEIMWVDRGRYPQVPSNPAFPDGIHLDITRGAEVYCSTPLPYPAKRCGEYVIRCSICRRVLVVCTTTGRPDDPRSIKFGCGLPTEGI